MPINIINKLASLIAQGTSLLTVLLQEPRRAFSLMSLILSDRSLANEYAKYWQFRRWLWSAEIATVLDVGAHQGRFAFAMRRFLPEAQIYSFEPQSDCFRKLNQRLGKDRRFQAFEVALGESQGSTVFFRCEYSESSSILPMSSLHKAAFPWASRNTTETVTMNKLDNYLPQLRLAPKVLLKIDVQGYEDKVLLGGLKLLDSVDYLLIEVSFKPVYSGQFLFGDIYKMLIERNFRLIGNFEPLLSPLDGSFLQSDMLFGRNG
jgi:FkbM family methyltransferase